MDLVELITAKIIVLAHLQCTGCAQNYINKDLHSCYLDSWLSKVYKYFEPALKHSKGPNTHEEKLELFFDVLLAKLESNGSSNDSKTT
jgi:carbonic anhydrase